MDALRTDRGSGLRPPVGRGWCGHRPRRAVAGRRHRRGGAAVVDMKLEVVVVPVSDVDRAKTFYQSLGWRLDADFPGDGGFRVVQLTPPGSACSIIFGSGVTSAAPGSTEGLQLVVTDVEAARTELVGRGVE